MQIITNLYLSSTSYEKNADHNLHKLTIFLVKFDSFYFVNDESEKITK